MRTNSKRGTIMDLYRGERIRVGLHLMRALVESMGSIIVAAPRERTEGQVSLALVWRRKIGLGDRG